VQTTPFTLTKIQPPRARPNLIAREALERRLGEALISRRLTLISAPAGYGKTTAMTRLLERLCDDIVLAWIAADQDDDLHRFLSCLFAALEPFDLPWRVEPDALIAAAVSADGDPRAVATVLLNALAASEVVRGVIVVDDAHRISDQSVFGFLDLLLERLPSHWGVVISSRMDPPLAIARLRAQDELLELRQRDLRFVHDEVRALVAANGGIGDAAKLLRRTGGWAAGLRLAINAARGGSAGTENTRAMDRHAFDYLAAEVLCEMPSEMREFLLDCAVLAELTPERCMAVSGNPRAPQLLDEIERRGLFVSVLDGPEPVLMLHDLFRDFLEATVRRERPESLPILLRRAADSEPDPIRRLSFLLRACAWDEAEAVLESVAEDLIAAGSVEPVLRLVEQFPIERRESSPMLDLVRGQANWAQWHWRSMSEVMRRASDGFMSTGDQTRWCRSRVFEAIALTGNGLAPMSHDALEDVPLEHADFKTRALAQALRTWIFIDTGAFRAVAPGYTALLDVLERTDRLELWYECFQRPLYIWMPGMRAPLVRFVDGVFQRAGEAPTQMRAVAHVVAAWLALWNGELSHSRERLALAWEDARWLGEPVRLRMFVNTAAAVLHAVLGEREAALNAIEELLRYFKMSTMSGTPIKPTSMMAHYLFLAVRVADALGDGSALAAFAARIPPAAEITNFVMLRAPLQTVPARIASSQGYFDDACSLWSKVLADPMSIEVIGLAEEAKVRYSHALVHVDRPNDAADVLRSLILSVVEHGEIGGVLLAGRTVLSRLATVEWRGLLSRQELSVLRGWAQLTGAAEQSQLVPESGRCAGTLSHRELEVLAKIAKGDSNKLIARSLDLSPHTVKRHVANILDKLDLSSRRQAAEWYRSGT
jgi:LuxR family transcriptional regulator, maltose regulon positive regulatory protein